MSRQMLIAALAVVGLASTVLCTGCAFDAPDGDARQVSAVEDLALDGATFEIVGQGEDTLDGSEVTYDADDRGGPDPTPWQLGGDSHSEDDGELVSGPDPTPWHSRTIGAGSGEGDGDDDLEGAAAQGPDPTPWHPDSARDEDDPWLHEGDSEDSGEPDPQPWETARTDDGGSSND